MPELFKLVDEKYSEIYQEKQWTYSCLFPFTFKKRTINKITITDHPWRKKGREWMTRELILKILITELNGKNRIKPKKRVGSRDIYTREWISHEDKDYLLVFWFEDNNSDWLWVRNCYPIS